MSRSDGVARRRGTAIVDTPEGILVVQNYDGTYILPGGGAKKTESRMNAAIRELKEETDLVATRTQYLFDYEGLSFKNKSGRLIRNQHKVFLIEASGVAKPKHEVKHIAYWKPGSELELGNTTRLILIKYLKDFKKNSHPVQGA